MLVAVQTTTPPSSDDPRAEARRVLALPWTGPVAGALKVFGPTVAVAGAISGGLIALKAFSVEWFLALGALSLVVGVVTWVVLENQRLRECKVALRAVLAAEKNYEALIADARNERDNIQRDRDRIAIEADVSKAFASVVFEKLADLNRKPDTLALQGESAAKQLESTTRKKRDQ